LPGLRCYKLIIVFICVHLLRAVLRYALRAALTCVQNVPYILVRLSVDLNSFVCLSALGWVPLSAGNHYPAESRIYMRLAPDDCSLLHFPKMHIFAKMGGLACDFWVFSMVHKLTSRG